MIAILHAPFCIYADGLQAAARGRRDGHIFTSGAADELLDAREVFFICDALGLRVLRCWLAAYVA